MLTLSIDCGGSGIKGSVLDESGAMVAERVRVAVPYPLTPERLLDVLEGIAGRLPTADRVTIGHPGMVRRGLVEFTPHYIRLGGPHTAVDPDLVIAWTGWEAQRDVAARLGKPTLVLNDAEVHAAAVMSGVGVELFLGLGTGLACAYVVDGALAPHIELSHAPLRRRKTYDTFVGEAARRSIGRKRWSRRTCAALAELRPVFLWDRLYLGGGGARKLVPEDVHSIGPDVVVVANEMGIRGGARAWALFATGTSAD